MIHLLEPPRPPGFVSGGYRFHDRVGEWLAARGLGMQRAVDAPALRTEIARLRAGAAGARFALDGRFVIECGAGELPPHDAVLLVHGLHSEAPGLAADARTALAAREHEWFAGVRRMIVTGAGLAQRLRTRGHDVVVVTPGVDACFHPGPPPADDGRIQVTCIGTIWPGKGQLDLVTALATDRDFARMVSLQLLGDSSQDPAYVEKVRATAAAAGLDLVCTGCVPPAAVADRLRASHLFVSASRVESYGMAVAEALACQVPVLAFAAGEVARFAAGNPAAQLLPIDAPADRFRDVLHGLLRATTRPRTAAQPAALPTWAATAQAFEIACRP